MPAARLFSELMAEAKRDPERAREIEKLRQETDEEMRQAAEEFEAMHQRVAASMSRHRHIIERLERT